MLNAIEAQGLGKTFSSRSATVEAVADLSFEVAPGEAVGLIGPNGAGKTTTMRMLATLENPSAGRARVAGHDLRRDPRGVRRSIGLVAQSGGTRPTATARDELVLQARLYRLPALGQRVRAMVEAFALEEVLDRPTHTLSGGQRRRLDLAIGLIHAPGVIFLDEPTAALDPPSRLDLWEHLRALRRRSGATIVLSTHHLDEAEALCDRILVLDRGRLIAQDSPAGLKQQLGRDLVVVDLGPDAARARAVALGLNGVRTVNVGEGELRIGCENTDALVPELVLALGRAGIAVRGLRSEHPSLDDMFLELTGRPPVGTASVTQPEEMV
ncbi:ABC transporter [Kineosporia sp. NBRC 101677]|uniref:ABC transporter ATP-binding protein n=1 Tax=Kineosporia sp. NBRC 101677 TaxID=3032197 RepID=UPI0024A5639A|nr:ABC transporter ATP-binding protein [Kineosporia sp. NBRC 101677]GLY15487.1 ABC transporter [Kineosporia sp. NBRC 101677]